MPILRPTDEGVRSDQPLIRLDKAHVEQLIDDLCRYNAGQFRLPTAEEWASAVTACGTGHSMPRRRPASGREPHWSDHVCNELGVYMPSLGTDEWVTDSDGPPKTVATVYRGSSGPEAQFRHFSLTLS